MKEKKNILLHLYGDPDAEGDLRSLLKDPELREEHRALSEAKFRLDHLARVRPEKATLDRIATSAAGEPDAVGRRRGDRQAVSRLRPLRRVLVPAISVAAVVVAAIGFGWFGGMSEEAAVDGDDALVQISPVEPSARMGASAPSAERLAPQAVSASDPLLAWDDAETIRNLYRRMESMQPTDLLDWGERSIPLETLPGAAGELHPPGSAGIQQARSERPPN